MILELLTWLALTLCKVIGGPLEIARVEKGLLIMVRILCLGKYTYEAVMRTTAEIAEADTLYL